MIKTLTRFFGIGKFLGYLFYIWQIIQHNMLLINITYSWYENLMWYTSVNVYNVLKCLFTNIITQIVSFNYFYKQFSLPYVILTFFILIIHPRTSI